MKTNRLFTQVRIALALLVLSLSSATIAAAAPDKPKYVGVYVEYDGKLAPIGWATKAEQAAVSVGADFAIVTYGININLGGGDILNPKEVVGLQVAGSDSYWMLNIEPLNMGEHYYRYTVATKDLPRGVYNFFIRSRIWGNKDRYYFRIEKKE